MTDGAMRTDGHTMAAGDAKLITAVDHGRKCLFGFEFDDAHRAHPNTDAITFAFFLINSEKIHTLFLSYYIGDDP
jgi:hypothetical protein